MTALPRKPVYDLNYEKPKFKLWCSQYILPKVQKYIINIVKQSESIKTREILKLNTKLNTQYNNYAY